MAKILGICGSPRRHSNTEILLDHALVGASSAGAEVEKIILNELCLTPCQGCYKCGTNAVCYTKDDMRLIYRKVDEADGMILASPVYFGSITAQLKIMIDRFEPYWVRKYMLKEPASNKKKRKGLFLCCAAENRPAFFTNARSVVRNFFVTLDIGYSGGLFCGGVSGPGQVMKKAQGLKRSFRMGAKLAKNL